MSAEFIIASQSARVYYDLGKGPWTEVDWSLTGDALRTSVREALNSDWGLSKLAGDVLDRLASRVSGIVGVMPHDRTLVSEYVELWQDATESYTKIGSRLIGSRP